MAKKTTLKTASLGYRAVGGNGAYTPVMGVLKGLTISQDDPDATEIEAEFYDTPFESDGYEDRIRVPKLKRKNAWKRFYKLYPNLKGKKVITGFSRCSSIWHLHSSMIKLKKKKK